MKQEILKSEARRRTETMKRAASMEGRIHSLELELRAERAGRKATQASLLEADEGSSKREMVWEAQRRSILDDADRLREMLQIANRERDDLALRVEALLVNNGEINMDCITNTKRDNDNSSNMVITDLIFREKAYEAEVKELTMSVSSLRDEIHQKEEIIADQKIILKKKNEALENARCIFTKKVAILEEEIASTPSKESISSMHKELCILRNLQYNAVDLDADSEEYAKIGIIVEETDLDKFEVLLIAKIRKIEGELLRERREKVDHLEHCKELEVKLESTRHAKQEAVRLVARLEIDLENAIAVPTSSTNTHSILASSNILREESNNDHSVVAIIMSQRDRLRVKCDTLEAEKESFKRELQIHISESGSLKVENSKLYEKIRFLQSFPNNYHGTSRNMTTGAYLRQAKSPLLDNDNDLEALEQRYEASVDPFQQFNRAEKQRKLREMSALERVVYTVAKTVLGSKRMRTSLFFYVLVMHLLVFISTYHWSHGKGCSVYFHTDYNRVFGGHSVQEVNSGNA